MFASFFVGWGRRGWDGALGFRHVRGRGLCEGLSCWCCSVVFRGLGCWNYGG